MIQPVEYASDVPIPKVAPLRSGWWHVPAASFPGKLLLKPHSHYSTASQSAAYQGDAERSQGCRKGSVYVCTTVLVVGMRDEHQSWRVTSPPPPKLGFHYHCKQCWTDVLTSDNFFSRLSPVPFPPLFPCELTSAYTDTSRPA